MQKEDDKYLIDQIKKGNTQAFEKLFDRYFQWLHNVAYNRLQSSDVADDLVQEIFADLWEKRKTLDLHTSATAWFYKSMQNKVYQFIRHQGVRSKEEYIKRIQDRYYKLNSLPESDDEIKYQELNKLITFQLNRLPEKTRNIFYLSREKQYSHGEIAKQLNCSPKTVEYHIGKVLKEMKTTLKGYLIVLFFVCFSVF